MDYRSRRRFLSTVTAATIVGVAGCTGQDNQPTEPTTSSPETTEENTPRSTPTPTETTPQPVQGAFPMHKYDPANTGHVPGEAGPAEDPESLWTFETDGAIRSSPVVAANTVYIPSWDGNLYALQASTGTKLWSIPVGQSAAQTTPAVDSDTLYLAGRAFDRENGGEQWSINDAGSSPTLVDGALYIQSENRIAKIDPATQSATWSNEFSGTWAAPAVADGTVFAHTTTSNNDGLLYAWDAETGDELWQGRADWVLNDSPVVGDGIVYVSGHKLGMVHAFDVEDGTKLWDFDMENWKVPSPAVADGTVVVAGTGSLWGLDAESGEELWSFQLSLYAESPPTVASDTVYVGAGGGGGSKLHAINLASGEELWNYPLPGKGMSGCAPAVIDGTVFIGDVEGNVHAIQ